MKFSLVLFKQVSKFRFTNYIPTNRIPGNVLIGKHRVRRNLSEGEKREMKRKVEIELENIAHLSRSYLTEEEENFYEKDPRRRQREEELAALQRRKEEIPADIFLKRDLFDRVTWFKKWE